MMFKILNHFDFNTVICTKNGLIRSLKLYYNEKTSAS